MFEIVNARFKATELATYVRFPPDALWARLARLRKLSLYLKARTLRKR